MLPPHVRHRLADDLAQDIQIDIGQLVDVKAGATRAMLSQLGQQLFMALEAAHDV